MEPDDVLYIIGNGFDLHHGVGSSYENFREWLRRNDRELFRLYSTVCRYDALWSDFENGLAYVDRDYFINGAELFLPDYSKDPEEWQIADIMLAGDVARGQSLELTGNLKRAFFRWIKSLRAPRSYGSKKLMIDNYARFLTFNYTEFLESEYGIEHDQIKYIHGHRLGGKSSIVIGHGGDDEAFDKWWNRKRYNKPRYNRKGKKYYLKDSAYKTYRSEQPEYNGIAEGLQEYYEETRKPVSRILHDNACFFKELYDIRVIYAWGFSFNPIDMPYVKTIIEANENPEALRWHVSYYGEKEKETLKERLGILGVDTERQVNFQPLSYWSLNRK